MPQPPAGHTLVKWGILEAFGIFAISVSGHTSLPVLRNSMKDPKACFPPCKLLNRWHHCRLLIALSMLPGEEKVSACLHVSLICVMAFADAMQPHEACLADPPPLGVRRE